MFRRQLSNLHHLSMKVVAVPVRSDNYAYILIDEASKQGAAVDIYDVSKVQSVAEKLGVTLTAALTTHHHQDHSGGNQAFALKYPHAPIYGGSDNVPAVNHQVKDKDEFSVGSNIKVRCLATPCHTRDSISYYVTDTSQTSHPGGIFTGDTLFIGGVGRFFEGTGEQMYAALQYIGSLPDETITYVGHEYTAGCLAFAKNIEPEGEGTARLEKFVKEHSTTTGLSTIKDEKEWNPYMRLDTPAVRKAVGLSFADRPEKVMTALRELKDKFPS